MIHKIPKITMGRDIIMRRKPRKITELILIWHNPEKDAIKGDTKSIEINIWK